MRQFYQRSQSAVTKTAISLFCLSSLLLTTACGGEKLPPQLAALPETASNSNLDNTIQETLPQIVASLDTISQKLDSLSVAPGAVAPTPNLAAPQTPATQINQAAQAATTPTTTRSAAQQPTTSAATPQTPAAPAKPALPSGQAEFEKILNKIANSPYAEAHIDKTELGLENGKLGKVELKMYMKRPNTVKLDIIKSTAGDSSGAKILYTSNQGADAKVRPGGGLSFITTSLKKADDRLASNNNFTFDDIDLIGVHQRMSQGYQAELVGKTQLNGTTINVLKVRPGAGGNSLSSKIKHEYIGYEPDTYTLRLWEMYDVSGNSQPFFRMQIKSINFPSSMSDSVFKL